MIECSLRERLEASEEQEWDEFVDSQRSGSLFQKPIWHKCGQMGGRVLYFSARRGNQLVLTAMISVPATKRRHSVLSGSCYRGPVCDSMADFAEAMPILLRRLKDIGVASLRIQPYWRTDVQLLEDELQEMEFRECQGSTHWQTVVLDLLPEEDEIFKGFWKETRRDIRRSKRMGITCAIANTESEARLFLAMQSRMASAKGHSELDRGKFLALWEEVLKLGHDGMLILSWYNSNTLIDGQAVLKHSGFAAGYRGASLPSGDTSIPSNLPKNHLGLWESILWAKRIGCTSYDLAGLPTQEECDDPQLRGIRHFKLGFSKNEVRLVRQHCIELRPGLLKLQRGYRWLRYGRGRKRERDGS